MDIQYSCFISYPHSNQSKLLTSIVMQLKQGLADEIGMNMQEEVYLDEERLKTGYGHEKSLARAICQSVCMIVIYSPLYQIRDYCLREFLAMEKIEKKRAKILGGEYVKEHRMIIPIIIREPEPIHEKIKSIRYWNLSKELLYSNLDACQECKIKIREIAQVIYQLYSKLKETEASNTVDCSKYCLPDALAARNNWKGDLPRRQPFPFR